MIKRRKTILLLLAVITFFGCHKDDEIEQKQPKIKIEKVTTTSNSATISWMVVFPGEIHTGIEISLSEDLADARSIEATKNQENLNTVYSVSIDSLMPMTQYYYRQVVWNSYKRFEFEPKNFTTKAGLPIVETLEVFEITRTSAVGGGKVISDSGAEIIECGICWATEPNPTIAADHIVAEYSHETFTMEITDLIPEIQYYVRAYAKNSIGFEYGNEVSFVTGDAVLPTVTTSDITDITWTTAKGGGVVIDDGDAEVTERGICWSSNHNPTISDNNVQSGSGTGEYMVNMSGLIAGTNYYVKAYAKNRIGIGYGEEKSFATSNPELPIVITNQVTNITTQSVACSGNVTSAGGVAILERGFCWATTNNPTLSDSHVVTGSGIGSFTSSISGLEGGTKYYLRAYATNSVGTNYGSVISFSTQDTYIDLGLPSGTLWATCNVGATTPGSYGRYFAWGEIVSKTSYNWNTYQFCMGSGTTLTKYCNNSSYGYNGFTDDLTVLQAGDDASIANLGSGWRMPTKEEWQELVHYTTSTWTTQAGGGWLFTANNGKSIFLPAAGYREESGFYGSGNRGYYWSSSLDMGSSSYAWSFGFNHLNDYDMYYKYRNYGFSVRPVRSSDYK